MERDEPLSDIPPALLHDMKRHADVAPGPPTTRPETFSARQDPAGATPQGSVTPSAPNSLLSFAGVDDSNTLDGFIYTPSDANIAVGPNHVVLVVNSLIAIYSKSGTLLSTSSASSWFSNVCSNCRGSDPRIAYDPVAGRWVMTYLYKDNVSTSMIFLSVSQTSDPTGAWWNWSLAGAINYFGTNTWADYPDLGFDGISAANGGAVYITTNQFAFSDGTFQTSALLILPKSSLYSGAGLNYWTAYNRLNSDATQAFSLRAARTSGNPGGEFLVNSENNGSTLSLWRVNPTYPPASVDWTLQATIPIGSYSIPPDAVQANSGDLVGTLDNRLYDAVWQNNRVYTAFTTAFNWGSGTVAAVRDLKVNTSTNSTEVNEVFGLDGSYYYSPAVAPDNADNMVFVFSRSGSSEYAGARYTGRLTTDSGTQGSAQMKAGTVALTAQPGNSAARWGDYQGVAVDPSDTSKVWIAGQWTTNLGYNYDYNWGTWIGQVQFTATAPAAPTASPASNVTSSGFTANWSSSPGATGYRLDVSTSSSFATYVTGYQNLDVANVVSRIVTGLTANTTYYYKVRAYNGGGTSGDSNTITVTTTSSSGFVINATFDSSITANGNAASIMAMINQAIGMYQTLFTDPMTVSILFRYATTGPSGTPLSGGTLAQSNYVIYTEPWATVINAIEADATSTNDSTANSSLPASPLTTSLIISSANGRAVGLSTPGVMGSDGSINSGSFDGIVTLNSSQPFQFTRPPSGGSYDALRSTEHEIDEVLGLGSFVSKFSNLMPQDLFSWTSAGTRNLTSSGSRYFSINGGTTNIVGFNQTAGGDFGDWLSGSCPQTTPYVQNAFSCATQYSDISSTSPEGINLDVIGYNLAGAGGTVLPPTSVIATAVTTTSVAVSWSAPSGTAPSKYHVYRSSDHVTYSQINGETTTGTSYTDSSASANAAYFYKVRSVSASSTESADSNRDLATTVIFTDPTLNAQSTRVKAAHITELRSAIAAVRTLAGLTAYSFVDSTITAGLTQVKKVHLTDLRTALDAARSILALPALSYTDNPVTVQSTVIKAAHIAELRAGVR
jgi:hypothetical protein